MREQFLYHIVNFLTRVCRATFAEGFKKNVFFEIQVSQTSKGQSEFGYAQIKSLSNCFTEEEVLFNPLNTFEIAEVKQLDEGEYYIKLKLWTESNSGQFLSQKQSEWKKIAALQKQEAMKNYCQGNALTNQYYHLDGADQYWNKFVELVNLNLNLKNKLQKKAHLKLQKAYGLFNLSYHSLINDSEIRKNKKIFECYQIIKKLFGDQNEIVKKFKNSLRLSKVINQLTSWTNNSEFFELKNCPEYNLFLLSTFDPLWNKEKLILNGFKYDLYACRLFIIKTQLELFFNFLSKTSIRSREMLNQVHIQLYIVKMGFTNQEIRQLLLGIDQKISHIDLTENKLQQIPQNLLLKGSKLEQLKIDYNLLKVIPQSVCNLINLKQLSLPNNRIECVSNISCLLKLKKLNLTRNKIRSIPGMESLRQLQQALLSDNHICELPEYVSSMAKLKIINLDNNRIAKLPSDINLLLNIELISVTNMQLYQIPNFCLTTKLKMTIDKQFKNEISISNRSMCLSYQQLKNFPKGLVFLKNLTEIDISKNGLLEFPIELLQLRSLRKIFLQENQIHKLPEDICNLVHLQYVNIEKVPLRQIPKFPSTKILTLTLKNAIFPKLDLQNKTISMKYNKQLSTFLQGMLKLLNLEQVDLSQNELTEFPKYLFNLSYLRRIVLHYNSIKELPTQIGKFHNLQELIISENKLTSLPLQIYNCYKLRKINLRWNNLTEVSDRLLSMPALTEMDISQNKLKKLPKIIPSLSQLEKIDLSINELDYLPNDLYKLSNLRQLSVSFNQLKRIPSRLQQIETLQYLDIRNNQIQQFDLQYCSTLRVKLTVDQSQVNKIGSRGCDRRNAQILINSIYFTL